jgi:ABC-type nitrate/sulfonate/bicarbonate transport system substrate-binding protein
MPLRVLRPLALVAAALAVLAAFHPASAADKLRVGKAVPYIFSFAVVEVGQAKGFFGKEGLDVESIGFQGGAKLHQGMISDAVDIGLSSGADLAVVSRGDYAKAVGAMAGPPLLMGVVVAYDSPFKTLDDLKGKKIGIGTVGSLTHWLSLELARTHGWGPDGVQVVAVGGSVPALTAALKLHHVDALMEAAAIGLNLEEKKQARLLSPVDYVKDFHIHMFFATNNILAKNPSAVTRFMKAWFETIKWMRANKAETVALVRKVTHFSEAVENKEYDTVMPMFSETGKFNSKALAVLSKSFVELKLLPKEPDLSKYVTEQYLPKM